MSGDRSAQTDAIDQVRSTPDERACNNAKLQLQPLQETTMADGVECGCNIKADKLGSSPVIGSSLDTIVTIQDVKQGGLGRVTTPVCWLQTGKVRRCKKLQSQLIEY